MGNCTRCYWPSRGEEVTEDGYENLQQITELAHGRPAMTTVLAP